MSFAYTRRREVRRPGGLSGGALLGEQSLRTTGKVGSDRNLVGPYRVHRHAVVTRSVGQGLLACANLDRLAGGRS
jgi:hypothetical protein